MESYLMIGESEREWNATIQTKIMNSRWYNRKRIHIDLYIVSRRYLKIVQIVKLFRLENSFDVIVNDNIPGGNQIPFPSAFAWGFDVFFARSPARPPQTKVNSVEDNAVNGISNAIKENAIANNVWILDCYFDEMFSFYFRSSLNLCQLCMILSNIIFDGFLFLVIVLCLPHSHSIDWHTKQKCSAIFLFSRLPSVSCTSNPYWQSHLNIFHTISCKLSQNVEQFFFFSLHVISTINDRQILFSRYSCEHKNVTNDPISFRSLIAQQMGAEKKLENFRIKNHMHVEWYNCQ